MNFLDALKEYISKGNSPDKIIFDVVYQLLEEFIFKIKIKKSNVSELRFEELKSITLDKLFTEGFKSVCSYAENDKDAADSIRYLISQYYNSQYLKANPEIQQLNDDVKCLLKQFSALFPQVGKAKKTEHKTITIADDYNIELFHKYSFSKNEPRKTRLKNIFFAMHKILSEKKSFSYSEVINSLKKELGISENVEIPLPDNNLQNENDDSSAIIMIPYDIFNNEVDESVNDYPDIIGSVNMENEKNIDSDTILESEESINISVVIDDFLRITTQRQTIIFGNYLQKENARLNEELASTYEKKEDLKKLKEFNNEKFKRLEDFLAVSKSTLYYENSVAAKNLEFVIRKYKLDSHQRTILVKELLNLFKEKSINFESN